ncbi:MAG: histidine phosphatase family protein, partial [Candidatus Woesearchaeota archaeon]|nr:histidine phosphatase family protein [Candidatus Woesearchaeota archaeon]
QAKRVALRLKDEKIDYIYSSDLARAADTAKEIAKFHKNIPIKFVQELRERNLGEFQGKTKKELGMAENTFVATFLQPKYGETKEALCKRADSFLHKILRHHNKDTVLFVGHNGINKAIICSITKRKHEDLKDIENMKNTSICIFDIDEEKNHKIHVFNCIKHLD